MAADCGRRCGPSRPASNRPGDCNPNEPLGPAPADRRGRRHRPVGGDNQRPSGTPRRYHEQIIRFTADASHELSVGPLDRHARRGRSGPAARRSADDYREALESLGEPMPAPDPIWSNKLLLFGAGRRRSKIELERLPRRSGGTGVGSGRNVPSAGRRETGWHSSGTVLDRSGVAGTACAFRTMVMNLLDNALKYTEPDGTIGLALSPDGRSALLTVEDTGIGIACGTTPLHLRSFLPDRPVAIGRRHRAGAEHLPLGGGRPSGLDRCDQPAGTGIGVSCHASGRNGRPSWRDRCCQRRHASLMILCSFISADCHVLTRAAAME